jgi:adenylate cyclase
MKLRLTTVRAKLTALVAFSAIVTLASLPVLSWIMDRQIVEQVDERVPAAVHGFGLEMSDDLRNMRTVVLELASQPEVQKALRDKRPKDLERLGAIFHTAYPRIDFDFFDAEDGALAQIEVEHPPASAKLVPELASLGPNTVLQTVTDKGCETGADAYPAFIAAERLPGIGLIMACLPLDDDYLTEVRERMGVELSFITPDGKSLGHTKRFPVAGMAQAKPTPTLVKTRRRDWALERFTPDTMQGRLGKYGAIVALDVTDIRDVVKKNLLFAVAVLAAATLVSILLGARLAGVMSRALSRVNVALKKLENQEYVHVDMVPTGDELEDLATGFNTMVDGLKERDKLRSTFGKYMTQTVMEHLMSGKVQLGGETLTVTVLFSDIRSFTTISEEMHDPQALVALLNEYFTEMVGIVIQEDGVVDKYIGDAIMAVFGAPVGKHDDAERAVRAAVRMRVALAHLNERLEKRGVKPLRTGIGVHTGEVVAGNIGSEARMEYTVIGDAVNLASRLESATKELGVDVLMSASTWELVKDMCVAEPVREIHVKGRVEPVMTYALKGLRDLPIPPRSEPKPPAT